MSNWMNVTEVNWPNQIPRLLWRGRKCPLCSSIEFQAAESGPLDGLLRFFGMVPVRCANCWRRYYCFSIGGK